MRSCAARKRNKIISDEHHMSTTKEYLSFLSEQLSSLDGISFRPMMGEYLIYYHDKTAAYVCDGRLLVRPTPSAVRLLPDAEYDSMTAGGRKKLLRVDNIDNKELLAELFEAMYDELPQPKKHK